MNLRRFLRLSSAAGKAPAPGAGDGLGSPDRADSAGARDTTLAGLAAAPSTTAAESYPWFKDATPFIPRGEEGLESRLEDMQGTITPTSLFYVRNNSASIDVDVADWRLSVGGDAVTSPLELSYGDIRNLPSRTLVAYLDCGGNQRAMFDLVKGRAAKGAQWGTGAVGNGEWTGVSLRDVLTLSGITDDAVSVLLIGLDVKSPEEGFRRVLPVEKAMDPDTILAFALNGELLPKDHGYPLRALVPGWVGSSSIKWLSRIIVSSERLWTRNNTTFYVLIGDAYPPEGEALGKVTTSQVIKSALALPWPAELPASLRRLRGYAHSPTGPITRVEWSVDSGQTWSGATVLEPQIQHSWARFEFIWDAQPGEQVIMTRATDAAGNTQPNDIPFNEKGYLFNQPIPHPIRVR